MFAPQKTTQKCVARFNDYSFRLLSRFACKEDGSLIIFAMFMFILMLFMGGMALDLMRFESERTRLQHTLDQATLAATNLSQTVDSEQLVRDMVAVSGFDPALVNVNVTPTLAGTDATAPGSGRLVAREVTTTYDLSMNTWFMDLLGVETLSAPAGGAAFESFQNVEISLVVDISGSMDGQKLVDLKDAAKLFFKEVVDETKTDGFTSISVVPYNHTIVVPDTLLSQLNTTGVENIAVPAAYTGALTSYPRENTRSRCVRFRDDLFTTTNLTNDYASLRAITSFQPLERMAFHDPGGNDTTSSHFNEPADTARRCDITRSAILPFETSVTKLNTHIDGLRADGWTAIDNGLKWGVALLDPAMRPVVTSMVNAGDLPAKLHTRPGEYIAEETMKVVVLMTDGANTRQFDLRDEYKSGPSPVWYSEEAANEAGPDGEDWSGLHIIDDNADGTADREKDWFDGYYVEMPANPADERFMRPHRLWEDDDATVAAIADLPADAVQLTWDTLFNRFSENAVAQIFNDVTHGDSARVDAIRDAEVEVHNTNSANRRMTGVNGTTEAGLCDVAKVNNDITVFSIAFSAGADAETVMQDCASDGEFYFDAQNGEELKEAFSAIAGAITKLRLTQ